MVDDVTRTAMTRDDILLTGKVALVTGGGGGIGRGIAIGMAEFGADVAVADIDPIAGETVADLVRAKGRRAIAIPTDVMDRDAIRAAIARTGAELGGLDILVNNAGGTRPIDLVDMSDRAVDRQIAINLQNLVTATQAAAQAMIAAGKGGAIINIASIEGMRAAPAYSVYAACKAGMINFTRSIALELGHHGIRVNGIAPDLVTTEFMVKHVPAMLDAPALETRRRHVPLQRAGNFDDCAGAAVFLASAMASYITGVTINVDGGTWASSGWARHSDGRWELFPSELSATF
ncbi:SDR family NAD(P)-dependent oxidoreductase [uncultured Sphingomonas sp.]|uniref:SDR family NAD(P)-dependent oxidoreductase n=1 Tax=uncultured Sphingomonas sp. TaxID=158754 RepID=UPI0035CAA49A